MDAGVRLLGPPAVRVDDAWVPLRPTKAHALFAYLAYRGAPVRRAELAALLWPDADAEHAFADVRQVLGSLRREPIGGLLGRDRGAVWLTVGSDLAAFRSAVAERRWADALRCHRGPLLEGFEIDDADEFGAWLASERSALAADWRRACRAVFREAANAGLHDEALHLADLLVRADPLDEQATCDAMRVAAGMGDLRGATVRFTALAKRLAAELGMAPEPATVALHQRLRGCAGALGAPDAAESVAAAIGESMSAPRAPTVADPPNAAAMTPLATLVPRVGRRDAVIGRGEAIAELCERLRSRDVRLLTLLGPGGIGKTTLAAAALAELPEAFPGGVFVAALEGQAGPDAVAVAAARAAGLRLEPRQAVQPQLTAALDGRRALLLLDGFETHLDQVRTVDALVRETTGPTLLVTSRRRLGLSTEVVVEVGPLATDGRATSPAGRLFHRAASWRLPPAAARALDAAAVERVARLLGGHPLALELAAGSVGALGLAGLEGQLHSSWVPLSSDEVDRSPRRCDVRAVIEETWRLASPGDRDAWARLAIMPGSLDRAVAAEVSGGGWRALRRLLDHGVLGHRGDRLEIHALLGRFGRERSAGQAALVDGAWGAALAIWRARAAREIDPDTGRWLRWHPHDLEQALGAGRWAVARGAWDAVGEMGIGLWRAMADAGRALEAQGLAEETVVALRRAAPAAASQRRGARRGPRGEPLDRDVALARASIGTAAVMRGSHFAGGALRALALARRAGDDRAFALAMAWLCTLQPTVRVDERLACARAAFERAGDRVGLGLMLGERALRLAFCGRHDEAGPLLRETQEVFRALGDPLRLAKTHQTLAVAPLLRGDLDAARRHVAVVRAAFEVAGFSDQPTTVGAWLAILEGPREAAACAVDRLDAVMRKLGASRMWVEGLRCAYLVRFGTPDEVAAQARSLLRASRSPDDPMSAYANLVLADALVRLGELGPAREALAEGVRVARALHAPRFVAHAALAAAHLGEAWGASEEAVRLLAAAAVRPAVEHAVLADARPLASRLGLAWPPEAPVAEQDDDVLLERIEGLLGGGRSSSA
jgi:DNA-binding SARP family transcriptional activator